MKVRESLENWLEDNLFKKGYHVKLESFERTLINLSSDFDEEILLEAEKYLEYLKENFDPGEERDEETNFNILLSVMIGRGQEGALKLLEAALIEEAAESKVEYLHQLQVFPEPEIKRILLAVLPIWESYDEYGGEGIAKVIDQLGVLGSPEAEKDVYDRLGDKSFKVRAAAIQFLSNFGIQANCDLIVKQLGEEEDPTDILEVIASFYITA